MDSTTTGNKGFVDGGVHTFTAGVWWFMFKPEGSGCSVRTNNSTNTQPMPLPAGFNPVANTQIGTLYQTKAAVGLPNSGVVNNVANPGPARMQLLVAA